MYADDSTTFYFGSSVKDIVSVLERRWIYLPNGFNENYIISNLGKTRGVPIKSKKRLHNNPQLMHRTNSSVLKKVNQSKLLGIRMDSSLMVMPYRQLGQ